MISSNYILLGISGFIIVIFFIIYFRESLFNAPVTVFKTIKNPRKPGIIDNRELRSKQTGFVDSRGQLKRDTPVEAIDGVSYAKAKSLRKQGYNNVGDFLRKRKTTPGKENKIVKPKNDRSINSFINKITSQPKKLNPIKKKPDSQEEIKISDRRRKQLEQGRKTKEYYRFYLNQQGLEKLPKNSRMTSLEISNLMRTIDKSSSDFQSQDQVLDSIDLQLSYDENRAMIEEKYGKKETFRSKKQVDLAERDFLEQQPVDRKTGAKRLLSLPNKQINKDLNEDSSIIFADPNQAWLADPEYSDVSGLDTKGTKLSILKKEAEE